MKKAILLLLPLLFIVGCFESKHKRWYSQNDVKQGKKIFIKHCAICHKENAESIKEWKKTDKDGFFPPPPLNGSAHSWHHSFSNLLEIINDGGSKYKGKMPPFKTILTRDEQILTIAFFQNFWSDEIYNIWITEVQKTSPK